MRNFVKTITLGIALTLASTAAIAEDYAVVVNAANNSNADKSEVKSLFLKQRTAWNDGTSAVPLGRSDDSPEQQGFNAAVLGMSSADLSGHWQAEKQKTGETPPKSVGSEGILFRQIKRKPGAFGVVLASSAAALPDGIKVLFKFSD